jgi:hypothetical protein
MKDRNLLMNKLSRSLLLLAVTAILGALLTPFASAQEPAFVNQVWLTVKPDRTAEFLDIQQKFTEAFKEGGGLYRGIWRNRNNLSQFVVITPMENYAAYDSTNPLRKAMSEGDYARLVSRYMDCLQSRHVVIREPLQEFSIQGTGVPDMVHTIETRVRSGRVQEYLELIRQIVQAYKKVGLPAYGISQAQYGAPRTEFMSWRPIKSMADLDGPTWGEKAIESMGEEAAEKWRDGYRGAVAVSEHGIWAYMTEASFYPEP